MIESQGQWRFLPTFCDFLYRAHPLFADRGTLLAMMIVVGCDHGGVELKDFLVGFLRAQGQEVRDYGTQGRGFGGLPRLCRVKFPEAFRRAKRSAGS